MGNVANLIASRAAPNVQRAADRAGQLFDVGQPAQQAPQQAQQPARGGLLRDLFDISIPGQRINAARQERVRNAREAAAFDALNKGDIARVAAISPELADRALSVQVRQQQMQAAQQAQTQDAALKFGQAYRRATAAGKTHEQAVSELTPIFGRIAPPEVIGEFAEQLRAPGAADAFVAAYSQPGERYKTVGGGSVYDTQTDELIQKPADPLIEARLGLIGAQTEAAQARAEAALARAQGGAESLNPLQQQQLIKLQRENAAAAGPSDPNEIEVKLSANDRTRIVTGLPGLIAANRKLKSLGTGSNALANTPQNLAASLAGSLPGGLGDAAEKLIGDDERDALVQASSAYESSVLPIRSGLAVTESEAKRFIRSSLPQPGDSPALLAAKESQRELLVQTLRAAAGGKPINIDKLVAQREAIEAASTQARRPAAPGQQAPTGLESLSDAELAARIAAAQAGEGAQ